MKLPGSSCTRRWAEVEGAGARTNGEVRPCRLLALVLEALGLPYAKAAPFLRDGVTPGSTGVSEDAGPGFLGVVFELSLPGSKAEAAGPILIDRIASVATTDQRGWAAASGGAAYEELTDRSLWRLGLETGIDIRFAENAGGAA